MKLKILKKKQHGKGLIILSLFIQQLGCSASVEGGDGVLPKPPTSVFSKPSINGPKIEGQWSSGCVSLNYGESKQVDIEFKSNNFSYTNNTYSDLNCSRLQSHVEKKGTYQFSGVVSETVFSIDYSYLQSNYTYIDEGQLLKFENDLIYISEFQFTHPVLNLEMPLHKMQVSIENENSN